MAGSLTIAGLGPEANALAWWIDAGADVTVGEGARAWFAASEPRSDLPVAGRPEFEAGISTAHEPVVWCKDVAELSAAFREKFGSGATLFQGFERAAALFVINAPDARDSAASRLLGGEAGLLFERMLTSIGLARETVCLATLAPHTGLGAGDASMALSFTRRLLDLVAPRAVVALGTDSTAALVGSRRGVAQLRGRLTPVRGLGREHSMFATFHPEMLLSQPAQKALAWADLLRLKALLA